MAAQGKVFQLGTARPRVRLVVFPHAGGGPVAYRPWQATLPDDVALCLVRPPGREARVTDPHPRRMDGLAEDVLPDLVGLVSADDAPYVLFGHSMGALLAYAVALRLERADVAGPAHLVASAHEAPHLPPREEALYRAPDARLAEELVRLGGTPREVLDHAGLMALVLPVFRDDLEAAATFRPEPVPVSCPVTVVSGREDPTTSEDGLRRWEEVAPEGRVVFQGFPGGHFFLGPEVLGFLMRLLDEVA